MFTGVTELVRDDATMSQTLIRRVIGRTLARCLATEDKQTFDDRLVLVDICRDDDQLPLASTVKRHTCWDTRLKQ